MVRGITLCYLCQHVYLSVFICVDVLIHICIRCGAYGVVLEAWQLANGHRGVRRAVKLVHSKGVSFTETEARRLQREVCSCMR